MAALLAISAACGEEPGGKQNPKPAPKEKPNRPLDKRCVQLVESFAQAVVAKNYEAAYRCMSDRYQRDVGRDEFLKSISRYRDGVQGALTWTVRVGEDDPKNIKNDAVAQLFVGDPKIRESIIDEAIIDFKTGGEGWGLVLWCIDEAGSIKILNYYQDD